MLIPSSYARYAAPLANAPTSAGGCPHMQTSQSAPAQQQPAYAYAFQPNQPQYAQYAPFVQLASSGQQGQVQPFEQYVQYAPASQFQYAANGATNRFAAITNNGSLVAYAHQPAMKGGLVADHAHAPGTADAHGPGDVHGPSDAHGGGHVTPKVPPSTPIIRAVLVDGSYGPTVAEGIAHTVKIPDGKGFGNVTGRQQNADDKAQNNYSVTDANFYPTLGVLRDQDTGKPMNYVKQIQAYNAAGYVSTFHPDAYSRMVDIQDAGQGSVLGMALNLMGVSGAPLDPGFQHLGVQAGIFATERVPGSPILAKDAVMSGTDLAGEEWARPHHAESSWPMYKALIDAGLDYQTAGVLSGDDAVSGAGRMNGFNNQNGNTGFNDDEKAIYQIAARVQERTGIPVVQILAGGHAHTGLDDSAKTKPAIDKLTGVPLKGSDPAVRANAIYEVLTDGTIRGGDIGKFDLDENHRGMGFDGTVSQTLLDAVSAAKDVQRSGRRR